MQYSRRDNAHSRKSKVNSFQKPENGNSQHNQIIQVIGDKEAESTTLVIRDRRTGTQIESNIEELIESVRKETKDKPFMPLNLHKYLSKRPQIMV